MNPRERVLAALGDREPDRVPIDLGGSIVTSITKAAHVPLRDHLGLPSGAAGKAEGSAIGTAKDGPTHV